MLRLVYQWYIRAVVAAERMRQMAVPAGPITRHAGAVVIWASRMRSRDVLARVARGPIRVQPQVLAAGLS